MSLLAAALITAAAGGAILIVRRGKKRDKKRKSGTPVPAEPAVGDVAVWHRSYYTLVVEHEDTPGLPKFTWGVMDTAHLRAATPAGAKVPNFKETMAAGFCYGLGDAETYDDAVREAQLWADTIREPLEVGETLATAIDGVLIVVAPNPEPPIGRWMVYAFPAASWPKWDVGELPGPADALWSMEERSQDGAIGQGVLYARTNGDDPPLAPAPDPEAMQVGATAANTGQQLEWSGRPGASGLIAVGARRSSGKPAAASVAGVAIGGCFGVGARWRRAHRRRPTIVRRARRARIMPRGRTPPPLRWVGESVAWWYGGMVLVLSRTGKRGPHAYVWSAFDGTGLQHTGWDLLVATARGYRLGIGTAPTTAKGIARAQAFVTKYSSSHARSQHR